MAIADEEVRIERREIELNMSHAMRAIDAAEHAKLLASSRQALKRHSNTGHADYCVEDGDLDVSSFCLDVFHLLLEFLDDPVVFHWVCALDLDNLGRRSLRDVCHCLLARPVDGGEVQDVVALFELQIAQDGVDACCGVGKVHHCLGRCVQKLSRRQFEGTIVKGDM
jgi:hypothetical protein